MTIRTILACLLALSLGACSKNQTVSAGLGVLVGELDADGKSLEDRPNYHDFGEVPFGDVLSHTFTLTNKDPRPVKILSTQGACSCTSVQGIRTYNEETGETLDGNLSAEDGILELQPGQVAEFVIRVDTRKIRKPNMDKLNIMRVRTDSLESPFLMFELRVLAIELFQATPRIMRFNDVPESYGATLKTDMITAKRGSPVRVLGIERDGQRVSAELEESTINDEYVWTLVVTVPEQTKLGPLEDEIVLRTTNSQGIGDDGRFTIKVHAQVVHDIIATPRHLNISGFSRTEPARAEALLKTLVPGRRVSITDTVLQGPSSDLLDVEIEAVDPDANGRSSRWNIALTSAGGLPPGRIDGTLVLVLDDSQQPEVRLPYRGIVQ